MTAAARHRRALGSLAGLAGVAICAACGSAYSQADNPTGGAEAGPAESSDNDATLSEAAATDALATDADGGSLDAAALSRCEALRGDSAAADFFCTDFDDAAVGPDGVPTGWTSVVNANNAGTIALLDDAGMDASRALDITVSAGAVLQQDTRLRVVLAPLNEANTYLHYQLDFDLRVVTMSGTYVELGALAFVAGSTSTNGIADYDVGGGSFALSHETNGGTPVRRVANDTAWHHAHVVLDLDSLGSYKRALSIDGLDVTEDLSEHPIPAAAGTELWIGVFGGNFGAGIVHAQFDNVVLRRRLM